MIKQALKKVMPLHWRMYVREILYPNTGIEEVSLRQQFYSFFIKQNDLVFDVGANFGNRVKAFLALKANVVAVEPQKSCYKYLKLKFGNKIQLITKGLGAKKEIKKFFIADSSTISTFSEDYIRSVKDSGRFGNNQWNKTEEIEITTLDELIQLYGIPAFIKIDVEGFEKEVLSGLSKKVHALSFEYNVPEQLAVAKDCINVLTNSNPQMKFNFSAGESMKLEIDSWLSASDMLKFIDSNEFISTGFGDIYGKNF